MDITGEVLYITYLATEANGFCKFTCKTSSGQYTVDVGHIEGSTYVVETTYTLNSNQECLHYFGEANGTYKVLRVTGLITNFNGYHGASFNTFDSVSRYAYSTGMLELYGRLPHLNGTLSARDGRFIQSIDVRDIKPTSFSYAFQDCVQLANVKSATWDTSNVTTFDCAFRRCYALRYIDLSG